MGGELTNALVLVSDAALLLPSTVPGVTVPAKMRQPFRARAREPCSDERADHANAGGNRANVRGDRGPARV